MRLVLGAGVLLLGALHLLAQDSDYDDMVIRPRDILGEAKRKGSGLADGADN